MWNDARCDLAMVVLDEVESLQLDDTVALGPFIAYSQQPSDFPGEAGTEMVRKYFRQCSWVWIGDFDAQVQIKIKITGESSFS